MAQIHIAKLQMKMCLASFQQLLRELNEITPENVEPKLQEMIQKLKNDLNRIQRVNEISQLAAIPAPEED